MMRLVQLKKGPVRRVAVVEEPHLRILDGCTSVYELATCQCDKAFPLAPLGRRRQSLPLRRRPLAGGNEFSDHRFEKKNYLNLAGSKLRTCALGPELVLDPQFSSVSVKVEISRGGRHLWSGTFRTGEDEMCHSLRNLEHHHFKFEAHRRPGDVHVHFFGTDCLSFGAGIKLEDGDSIQVSFGGFGRPLRNTVHVAKSEAVPIEVSSLG